MWQAVIHPQKHQFKWASQKQLQRNGHQCHPNDESVPMDINPLVFTQIRQATVSSRTTEAKPSHFQNEGQCFYCGDQGHMAHQCLKKKYQYSKPHQTKQKSFPNWFKHFDHLKFNQLKYDQPKSDHNWEFWKSNKQSLKFGYFPQGHVASIEEVEEEDENKEYQESYELPSLAACTARLSTIRKKNGFKNWIVWISIFRGPIVLSNAEGLIPQHCIQIQKQSCICRHPISFQNPLPRSQHTYQ